jgi:hypothetical protein
MASLYEQLMAAKGAPKAAAAPNSTQLRKAPVSLRSAMRKYAAGGDVTDTAPDYSRANDAFGGAGGVNDLRNQFLGMGLDENTIGSIFSKYYAPEPQQGMSPQAMTPPEPMRYSPEPTRPPPPEEPRYEEPPRPIAPDRETPYRPERLDMPEIYPEDYAGPRTTGSTQTQQVGPRTSYRQEADGTLTEIGYNGDPISGYTPEQLAMHNATTGVTPPEYRYVWNGEGYDKLPNGPQIGYNPEPRYPEENVPPPPPREDPREEPRYYEPEIPQYPEDRGFYQPPVDYTPTRPVDYYNPSPPMDYTTDPGFYQPPVYDNPAIGIAKSLERGGDIGKLVQDLASRGQTSDGLAALIAKILASGGGGSLEKQRGLMELLGSIKGK